MGVANSAPVPAFRGVAARGSIGGVQPLLTLLRRPCMGILPEADQGREFATNTSFSGRRWVRNLSIAKG
jgi:hypothetical protein